MSTSLAAILAGSAGLAALAWGGTALAQQTPTGTSAEPPALETITVTARRMQESLQSVPLTVTAVTSEALEQRQVRTAEDLSHIVPALSLNSPFGGDAITNVRLRGLPGVATYFAEVPTPLGGNQLFVDLENVQVLKGPQGVTFGLNTTGGAILLEPRRPSNDFEGSVKGTVGNKDRYELQAVLNVPIVEDKILFRFAFDREDRGGYTRDLLNGTDLSDIDYWYGRASLIVRPVEALENYTILDFYSSDSNGPGAVLTAVNPRGVGALVFPQLTQMLAAQQGAGVRTIVGQDPGLDARKREEMWRVVNTTTWNVTDAFAIKNIASFRRARGKQTLDLDGSPALAIAWITPEGAWNTDTEAYSEELQLSGKLLSGGLDWVSGFFYERSKLGGDTALTNRVLGSLSVRTDYGYKRDGNAARTRGAYAQGIYDFGTLSESLEGLRFTAGYRYTWDDRRSVASSRNPAGVCVTVGADANCISALNGRWHASGYTVALDYQLRPDSLIYARSSRGYMSGGFNQYAPNPETRTYKPEYLTDVELGLKSDWQLGAARARTNVSVFYGKYEDIQRGVNIRYTDALGRTQVGTATLNAAKANIRGAELEATISPLESLTLGAAYSYVRARYDEFMALDAATGQIVDRSGLAFTNFPEQQASLSGRYRLPIGENVGKISLSAFYTWQSRTYFGLDPADVGATEPSYDDLSLRLDWNDVMRRPLDAALFVTNATDSVYRQGSFTIYGSLGTVADVFAPPRLYGFELRYRW